MIAKVLPILIIAVIGAAWFLLPLPELEAQVPNGITSPAPGEVVAGVVLVKGNATDLNFLRYELAFTNLARPGSEWIVFSQGDHQVISDTLAVWDTSVGSETAPVYPDGLYELRLRVVRTDYNYNEYFATNLIISNSSPTPSPTVDFTATAEFIGTTTPVSEISGPIIVTPDVLPSLTPFPTPSPLATTVDQLLGPAPIEDEPENEQGIIQQVFDIDFSRFSSAFWQGAIIAGIIFGFLAAYLLARGVFRRIWRGIQTKIFR